MKTSITNFQLLTLILTMGLAGCTSLSSQSATKAYPHNQPIQQIADKAVVDAKKSLHPKAISVVVAEPKTGKILAMCGWRKETIPQLMNESELTALTMFEPGSTFKPMVAVAALEKGVINPKTKINCGNGLIRYQGKLIKDHMPIGESTVEEILAKSSNVGAFWMALMLKDTDYYHCIRRFGFGEKTGMSLPWEFRGLVNPPSKWLELSKAHMSFGQSVAVTPIQLTMAYCALANGGNLMRPVVRDQTPKLVRRVCSESTANLVKNALQKTISTEGAAPMARVKGVTAGGMAGTVHAISPEGGYLPDQNWTLFAGFFPVNQPRYVVVVVVDEAMLPPSKNFGRLVAAPIFSEIAGKITALQGARFE